MDKWRLCDVVIGDECWLYHRHISKKQSTQSWVNEGKNPRTIVQRQQNEHKTMFCIFFKTTVPVIVFFFLNKKLQLITKHLNLIAFTHF
jgi:hypothetical protein